MLKYMGVSLPITLISKIDDTIQKYPFTSRPDFVKQAIRHELERLERKEAKQCQTNTTA